MCVIAIVDDENFRPNEAEIDAMWQANNKGAGVAWRADGKINWRKGLDIGVVQDLVQSLPAPFIVHFRIPSVGGDCKALTHPFPVTPQVALDLEGSTAEHHVLFHNGHWNDWKKATLDMVAKSGGRWKLPVGKWSDSRAMAFLAASLGLGILEFIDEKAVVFGPKEDDLEVFGSGWTVENGFIVSNTYWKRHVKTHKPNLVLTPSSYATPVSEVAGSERGFPHVAAAVSTPLPRQGRTDEDSQVEETPNGGKRSTSLHLVKGASRAATDDPFPWVNPKGWSKLTWEHVEFLMFKARKLQMLSQGQPKNKRVISKTQYKNACRVFERLSVNHMATQGSVVKPQLMLTEAVVIH